MASSTISIMPMTFQTSTLNYEERYVVYRSFIFDESKPSEIESKLSNYVERAVRKSGWKAIWSYPDVNGGQEINVLVEVINVDSEKLSAEVDVCKPLVTNSAHLNLHDVHELLMKTNGYSISLSDLLPVYDDSGEFDETAIALEHVRFFYDHLWREWDKDDDEDHLYAARNLENRLRLYYDIVQENLSMDFIETYTETYENYKQKELDFRQLRKDMGASDSEEELATTDVLSLAQKSQELESIVRSLQTMEDPQMRYLLAFASTCEKNAGKNRGYPVTIVVADQLKAHMCKALPDDAIVEHHRSVETALQNCSEGDTIFIHPGNYRITGCMHLNHFLAVTGVSKPTVECDGNEWASFITRSKEIQFSGIRFIQNQNAPNSSLFVVEKGESVFTDCEFLSSGVMVSGGAELVMRDCKIRGSLSAGLTIIGNSSIDLERCEIRQNGRDTTEGGIKIVGSSRADPATVLISECKIEENFGKGINIMDEHETNENETTDGCVRLQLNGNVIKDNTLQD